MTSARRATPTSRSCPSSRAATHEWIIVTPAQPKRRRDVEIQAAVTDAKGAPFAVQTVEVDELRPEEVLVKVAAAGICHTDLIVRDQWYPVPLPAVLGHEGAGVVEAVGSGVTKVAPGDHVVLSFVSCGECVACKEGAPAYCGKLYDLNFSGARPDSTTALSANGSPIHGH